MQCETLQMFIDGIAKKHSVRAATDIRAAQVAALGVCFLLRPANLHVKTERVATRCVCSWTASCLLTCETAATVYCDAVCHRAVAGSIPASEPVSAASDVIVTRFP